MTSVANDEPKISAIGNPTGNVGSTLSSNTCGYPNAKRPWISIGEKKWLPSVPTGVFTNGELG